MFIGEGLPAVLLGISVLFYLTDRPAKARWLTEEEREWLIAELAAERRAVDGVRVYTVLQAFANLRTLALAVIWLGTATAALGLVLFLPQILKQLGLSTMMIGFAAAIPYVAGSIGMVVWGYVSDRMHERRWNLSDHLQWRECLEHAHKQMQEAMTELITNKNYSEITRNNRSPNLEFVLGHNGLPPHKEITHRDRARCLDP